MSALEIQSSLMKLIGFSEEDLIVNHEGYIHGQQRLELSQKRRQWTIRIVLTLGAGIICCFAIAVTDIYGNSFTAKIAPLTTVSVVTSVIAIGIWFRRSQLDSDLKKGYVLSAEGKPSLASFNRAFSYTVNIQGEWFAVSKKVFSAFKEIELSALHCRIYFVPRSRTILSVEVLRTSGH